MNTVRQNAYAKLNLTLDLLGREGDYHLIDSLVMTVDLYDKVVVTRRKDRTVRILMRGMGSETLPPGQNNALRAGEAFVSRFRTTGADVTVYKNIPIGAGLGGSSADAAGVLNALSTLYGVDRSELKPLADELGSDTGYLLTGGYQRMRGRGELLEPLGAAPDLHFLLLCPRRGVKTAECYRRSDTLPLSKPHTEEALALLRSGNLEWAAKLFSNGLYPAAAELNPDVERAYAELREFSPWGVSMTGSGSGVFAVFETEELCLWAKSRYRGAFRAICLKAPGKTIKNPFVLSEDR